MHPKYLQIADYTYHLPDERIAKYPLQERDSARLLIYDNGQIAESTYRDLAGQIPAGTLIVFNQTRVVHARLLFKKPTGAQIEIFCLEPGDTYADIQTAMLQKNAVQWKCLVGGAAKWNNGLVLEMKVTPEDGPAFSLYAAMAERQGGAYLLQLTWDNPTLTFAEILHYAGKVPLPPYLNREADKGDEATYQTMFAKEEGSVAAPTAALHFTPRVVDDLHAKGIQTGFVTLHVGAGTFKPVKSANMHGHDMHAEWIEVNKTTIQQVIIMLDKGIMAVGTTSLRTLESLYWIGCKLLAGGNISPGGIAVDQWMPYEQETEVTAADALQAIVNWLDDNNITKLVTRTQILIAPGYTFRIIKGLVTNFHQPHSTLLLLVAAIAGPGWKDLYNYALQHHYRFLSYGDGCLLWL